MTLCAFRPPGPSQPPLAIAVLAALTACEPAEPRPPACGIPTAVIAPEAIFRAFTSVRNTVFEPPLDLPSTLPTRVVVTGHKSEAIVGYGEAGLVIGFQGAGFPAAGGYGLLVVDDSTNTYQGVMIYESARPDDDFPTIGIVSARIGEIPLYGVRVRWREMSNPRCPLLGEPDSR